MTISRVRLVGVAARATLALALFPIYGPGKAGEPASWRFRPGEMLTNLGAGLIETRVL